MVQSNRLFPQVIFSKYTITSFSLTMSEFDSSIEFVGDLMQFIMSYFNVDWSRPAETRGRPLPFINFTSNHANFILFLLETSPGYTKLCEDASFFLIVDQDSFFEFAFFAKQVLRQFAYTMNNFLHFATYIGFMAALASKQGIFNAPTFAMVIIYDEISNFRLRRAFSFSNSVKDTTTRKIL
ncbi:hypothetical protein HNY73_009126 [Argiope bruennichi]|uniref:Uncharacterized protein n=1 Tax=Argiope bruennichi TaxID=94029 RepID=A0A8T0FF39_ARGBR|nr:hypothetical protein HNY73_009126 [Argiope bruennichi]